MPSECMPVLSDALDSIAHGEREECWYMICIGLYIHVHVCQQSINAAMMK